MLFEPAILTYIATSAIVIIAMYVAGLFGAFAIFERGLEWVAIRISDTALAVAGLSLMVITFGPALYLLFFA